MESREAVKGCEQIIRFRECRYGSPPTPYESLPDAHLPPSYEESTRISESYGPQRTPKWVTERERAEPQFRALSFSGIEPFPGEAGNEWDKDSPGPRLLQNPAACQRTRGKRQRFNPRRATVEEQPEPTEDPATPSSPKLVEVPPSLPHPEVMAVELPPNSESTVGRDSPALPPVRVSEVTELETSQVARRDSSPPRDDGRRELRPRRITDLYGVTSTAVRTRGHCLGT